MDSIDEPVKGIKEETKEHDISECGTDDTPGVTQGLIALLHTLFSLNFASTKFREKSRAIFR